MARRKIAYYISSHGFGHATRAAPVLKRLAEHYRLFIKTEIPASIFRDVWKIPCTHISQPVDVGCAQNHFASVNVSQAFKNLRRFQERRNRRIADEVRWLEAQEIDLVITDVPSYPLKAARILGIPPLLLANFTWYDIYSAFPGARHFASWLELLRDEYSRATLQILPQCHIRNTLVEWQEEVGFLSLKGQPIHDQLESALETPLKGKLIVFVYLGPFDASNVQWKRLERLEDCVFLTRDAVPESVRPRNLHVLDDRFRFPDLIATADLVLTKAGYSTLATAFTHGKPVISCSRENFREFEVVREFLESRGVGLIVPPNKFYPCDWEEAIKKACRLTVKGKVRLEGEEDVFQLVQIFLGS